MSMTGSDLSKAREQLREPTASAPTDPGKRIDEVVKMYTDDERMAMLSQEAVQLRIGRGDNAKTLNLFPMTLGQVITFLPKLKAVLGPAIAMFKERKPGDPQIPFAAILETLSEKIDELPKLLEEMFRNGNNVDAQWFEQNLAFFVDMRRILPAFLSINGLDKLFNLGKAAASSPTISQSNESDSSGKNDAVTPITESSKPSASSADTTNGQTSTV